MSSMNSRDLPARAGDLVTLLCVLCVLCVCSDSVSLVVISGLAVAPAASGWCCLLACDPCRLRRVVSDPTAVWRNRRSFRAASVEEESSSDRFVIDYYTLCLIAFLAVV